MLSLPPRSPRKKKDRERELPLLLLLLPRRPAIITVRRSRGKCTARAALVPVVAVVAVGAEAEAEAEAAVVVRRAARARGPLSPTRERLAAGWNAISRAKSSRRLSARASGRLPRRHRRRRITCPNLSLRRRRVVAVAEVGAMSFGLSKKTDGEHEGSGPIGPAAAAAAAAAAVVAVV